MQLLVKLAVLIHFHSLCGNPVANYGEKHSRSCWADRVKQIAQILCDKELMR